ncbi:hypothetical protein IFM89_014232 [Coptis chinensis]|uniref:Reverse transcriptase zinc-binding domain-containing protein n=1 Tax=Coptis chinensis TaxID=261450 RepID=A0A835H556_9MAGN|nr:hypothetical protein IFM89_014232 [Coptis chinensis]
MKVPSDCSWVWIGVLQHRKTARKYIKYTIANGKDTWFWHDPWLTDEPLLTQASARNLFDFPVDTRVSHILSNGMWNKKFRMLQDEDMRSAKLQVQINNFVEKDRVVWTLSVTGAFTSKSAYMALRKIREEVKWYKVVWGKLVVPKHSFTMW